MTTNASSSTPPKKYKPPPPGRRDADDDESTTLPKKKKEKFTSLEPYLRDFFYWYGGFAYTHRWMFFFVPILLTPILGTGFMWFGELRVDDPAYVFTPKDARWKRELSTFSRLWPLEENKFQPGKSFEPRRFVNILCRARDGGNVLRPEILEEIQVLNAFLMYNITVPTYDGKFNLSYQDLCLSYDWVCGGNEHIAMFKEMKQVGRVIDLTFPKGGNKDTPVYLGTVLGDILMNRTDNHVIEARITQLFYFLKQDPESVRQYSTDFEYAVEKFILHAFESKLISLSFAHYQSLQDGLDENAQRFVPNFVISFTALSLYCVICAFILKRHSSSYCAIDWIRSKPYVACAGLFNTLIALISSFGLLLLIGVPYNVINTIIPFLIIAIGIDDMFIMTACYDQVDRHLPTHVRMAEMMRSSGVAVSITNVTDILSFLIGCMTDLPGVELFCIYAFVSVLFCYVYQLTFFTGLMAIMSEAEKEERHCIFLYKMNSKKKKMAQIYGEDGGEIGMMRRKKVSKSEIYPVYGAETFENLPPLFCEKSERNLHASGLEWNHHKSSSSSDATASADDRCNRGKNSSDPSKQKHQRRGQRNSEGKAARNSLECNDASVLEEDGEGEKTYERFYNESFEYCERPLRSYEYCEVDTIDRRRNQNPGQNTAVNGSNFDGDGSSCGKMKSNARNGTLDRNVVNANMSTIDRLKRSREGFYNGIKLENNLLSSRGDDRNRNKISGHIKIGEECDKPSGRDGRGNHGRVAKNGAQSIVINANDEESVEGCSTCSTATLSSSDSATTNSTRSLEEIPQKIRNSKAPKPPSGHCHKSSRKDLASAAPPSSKRRVAPLPADGGADSSPNRGDLARAKGAPSKSSERNRRHNSPKRKSHQPAKDDQSTLSPEEKFKLSELGVNFFGVDKSIRRPALAANHHLPGHLSMELHKSHAHETHHQHTASENRTHLFFSRFYGPTLLSNGVRSLVVIVYIGYLALALFGCSQFREGLEPSHLVTADHYIAKYFADIKMFWKMGAQLHVAVLNPPNLTDSVERNKLLDMVTAFEDTDYTMGREGTVFFLLEYLNYLNQLNAEPENTDRIWHKKLRSWLKYTGGSEQWERDIVYAKDGVEFEAFRLQVAMKNIVEPNQHKLAAKMLREVADAQPFHVEIYHEAFPFADQYLIILPSTYRNVLISLCVMTVIAFLLIPSLPSAMLIVLSIVSICTGVFGYMTFWGVNLDAISMISIIMSIGFAVDLSAHIVYAFVTAHGGETARERVIGALEHLGWPIFQGATSTIAGITVLYTVDAYIILTFFKTIWLTMVLGLVHGLIFIPVMLSFIPLAFFRISSTH